MEIGHLGTKTLAYNNFCTGGLPWTLAGKFLTKNNQVNKIIFHPKSSTLYLDTYKA